MTTFFLYLNKKNSFFNNTNKEYKFIYKTKEVCHADWYSPDYCAETLTTNTKQNSTIERTKLKESINPISATHNVSNCLKSPNKKFKVEKLGNKNPVIKKLIEDIAKEQGITNTNNLSESEYKKILTEAIKQYPEKILKPHLSATPGRYEELKNTFDNFGKEWSDLWNIDKISTQFNQQGKNALTIGGATYAVAGVLGLDSPMEFLNKSALKESFGKKWKMFLGMSVGVQVAGVPLLQSTGLIVKQGTEAIWGAGLTSLEFLDNIFSPSDWAQIWGGTEKPSLEEINKHLPKFSAFLSEPEKTIFNKLYQNETGKSIELSDHEIDTIARDLVLLSDDLNKDQISDIDKEKFWQRIGLRSMVDLGGFLLANHPNLEYRKKFEDSVNKYLDQKRSGILKNLYSNSFSAEGFYLHGEIENIIDSQKFNKSFFSKRSQSALKALTPQQKKSILESATSH
jgi:hypothetical protein